jgi:hypothetical protein
MWLFMSLREYPSLLLHLMLQSSSVSLVTLLVNAFMLMTENRDIVAPVESENEIFRNVLVYYCSTSRLNNKINLVRISNSARRNGARV